MLCAHEVEQRRIDLIRLIERAGMACVSYHDQRGRGQLR